MALLEAFAAGRPAVVFDLVGLRELVQHGETGLKAAAANIEDLGVQLKLMLTQDETADRQGKNARAAYVAQFSPAPNLEVLMRIYDFARAH